MGTLRLGSSVVVPSTVKQTTVPASIDPLSITPTTSQQIINATASIDGYAPVTINAVTSAIDANITAGNIKNGVSILGVTGNYAGIIPSGTLNITSNNTYDVTNYASAVVNVSSVSNPTNYQLTNGALTKATLVPVNCFSNVTSIGEHGLENYFAGNNQLSSGNLTGTIDFSNLTSVDYRGLYCTFNSCPALEFTDTCFSNLLTVNDWGMYQCCYGCSSLYSIDLNSLQSVGYRGLYQCFYNCDNAYGILDFSGLLSIGVGGMYQTFGGCINITEANFYNLDWIDQQGLMSCFYYCYGLTDVYFYSLTSNSFSDSSVFDYMLTGCSNVTVHFPSSLESTLENWSSVQNGFGGTNTTILYDLPATE